MLIKNGNLKKFLGRKSVENINENSVDVKKSAVKKHFIENLNVKENKEDVELIKRIKKDESLMWKMDLEELKKLNEVIKRREIFLKKNVEQLKNEIGIKEFQLRKKKKSQ